MEELSLFELFGKIDIEDATLDSSDIDIFNKEIDFTNKMVELTEKKNQIAAEIESMKLNNILKSRFFDDYKGYVDYDYLEVNKVNIFYSKIRIYISEKYKINLPNDKELYPNEVSLKGAKTYIISLLNGKNFSEIKREQEIIYYKSVLNKYSFGNSYSKIELNKNKLTIKSFLDINSYSSDFKLCHTGQSELIKLMQLLSFYEYLDESRFDTQANRICYLCDEQLAAKFDLSNDICKSIKLFKNKKVVIEFKDEKNAINFSREYTDYMKYHN